MVDRFVAPATSRISAELGPVRLHSCGPSTDYAEPFSHIENLRSLDLGGDTSIKRIREVFGSEMPLSVTPLPQDMSAQSAEPILNWARCILEENDGGDLGGAGVVSSLGRLTSNHEKRDERQANQLSWKLGIAHGSLSTLSVVRGLTGTQRAMRLTGAPRACLWKQ